MHPKIGVFHPGTQHSWQTALAFQESGQLSWYATSVFYDPAKWPYRIERILPEPYAGKAHRQFLRRYNPRLDKSLVRQTGAAEWLAAGAAALRWGRLPDRIRRRGYRDFARNVIKRIEQEPVDVVWGYDLASRDVFRWAKKNGLYCVLDRTIGHSVPQNQILSEEHQRHPRFFQSPFIPKSQRHLDEEQEEIDLADVVVVGSRFCAETLIRNGCPPRKVQILAYGYDETLFPLTPPRRVSCRGGPIKLLFVGHVSARKGMAYLLEAIMNIRAEDAALTLVGNMDIPRKTFQVYEKRVKYIPTVSRADVVKYFCEADCFIFPSLFEGSAIVLREIYGAGLGAIQSFVAGDGVIDGENGKILPSPTVSGLVDSISQLIDDPERVRAWQDSSWKSRGAATWSSYRQNAATMLNRLVD
jgi:glycosyltransferase involved in cell wall biosynthesis